MLMPEVQLCGLREVGVLKRIRGAEVGELKAQHRQGMWVRAQVILATLLVKGEG